MEDDDEFGDLYTDVLRPISSSSGPQSQLFSSGASASAKHPPDLNLQSDDEDVLYGAPDPSFTIPSQRPHLEPIKTKTDAIPDYRTDAAPNSKVIDRVMKQEVKVEEEEEVVARVSHVRVLDSIKVEETRVPGTGDGELQQAGEARVLETAEPLEKPGIGEVQSEKDAKDKINLEKDNIFAREEEGEGLDIDVGIGDLDSEPIIPGLSSGPFIPGVLESQGNEEDMKASRRDDSGGAGDDWDSDSEDDLQIVLNDNVGPLGVDRNEAMGSDDEDEDGEDLVIVADGDQHHQPVEEQEWGDDTAQAPDGERKEIGEASKVNGGMVNAAGARIGYSGHGYHPHHSQFKYVRPGAAAIPGGAIVGPGGAPGQVRPPMNIGPIAGRGRGDWRPVGVKTAPGAQKSFQSGFGVPIWASGSSGRGFGSGLEFTLPSHKTVFDVDIDNFSEKPWKHPGVDVSDFFNFGLDEESWKDYCKQLEQMRLEATMQSKIRVYESGRSEQDYDPDLPPELAAAAGIHDVSAENAHIGKTDGGQGDLMGQGRVARPRPPIPTGRAIQVEGGYGERLPSVDTRPPRIRDSDAIIEIVLQDSADDDSVTDTGTLKQQDNDSQGEGLKGHREAEEDIGQTETEYYDDRFPESYNDRKRETVARRASYMGSVHNTMHEGDGILPYPADAPVQYHPGSKGRTPVYPGSVFSTPHEERWPQGTARDRYPHLTTKDGKVTPSQSDQLNRSHDSQKEKSGGSIDGKQSPDSSSPITIEAVREPSVEQKDNANDDLVLPDKNNEVEGDEMASDTIVPSDNLDDGTVLHSVKKQKLSSLVEQPAVQEHGEGDDLRAARSSDNSKARSGSSREYQKRHEGDEEVVQDGQPRHTRDMKRHYNEHDISFRRRNDHGQDVRSDVDRNHTVVKGREDSYRSYGHRERDLNSPHYSHMKSEGFERAKERDSSLGALQRRDEETHGRRLKEEDTRKRERVEEVVSRQRSKVRESERNEKDEHLHSRKRVDNGDWRDRHDKEVGPRHRERDDNLMSHHENMDSSHTKRRKDEEYQRREQADKEELVHSYRTREDTSRRKRERDDVLEQRRRDDQARLRDKPDDYHSTRHRDDSWRQRERDDRQRLKQSHEDTMSKREREEGRTTVRSGRGVDDKQWAGNVRAKDDSSSKGLSSDKEYQFKDKRQHSEQPKRRERLEEESLSQHRGREDSYARDNQLIGEDRNSRRERSSSHNDRPTRGSDGQWMHKDRHKENARKSKESAGSDQNTLGPVKRKQEDYDSHRSEKISMKSMSEQESGDMSSLGPTDSRGPGNSKSMAPSKKSHHEPEIPQPHSFRKHGEDDPSDDEQQSSKRGRSKLERWTSQKEKDGNGRTAYSLSKTKDSDRINNDRSPLASERPDESSISNEAVGQHLLVESRNTGDLEKVVDTEPTPGSQIDSEKIGDRHLDTVAKLKKRSERFKLPMPSEKDNTSNKKTESEVLPLIQSETVADAEIKQERPARKRRWTGN
ncbi:PREDICTED: FIP1[V]-like protein [Nelumbo nucifera]|uniref:FIP1[V]-like protein n=2 Tax=Nelumbo nucifera TaxID=4432 RepID=A0A1U8B4D9_NELNU|nr:PREDICTED: FIP1[V]-like protein [Nelumbo nucifera]DAD45194.1 TPA_asm: hypothetical protein HUJ06_003424 [Nelumbo nucifera]